MVAIYEKGLFQKVGGHHDTHKKTLSTLRLISSSNKVEIHTSYKEDTRLGHIQRERLPKSKMASGDDRFTFEIVHVLRFGNSLTRTFAADLSLQIFNNH